MFGFPSKSVNTLVWQRRLSDLGISLETYTFAFFNSACTVNINLPLYWTFQTTTQRIVYHQHDRFYIGSTSITAAKRDYNRMAKLKQTLSDSAVHAELAIRYWASQPGDFEQFSTIVRRTATTYEEAWTFEHLLISKWQAPLNFPFITEFLKLKAKGCKLQYRKHNRHSLSPIGRSTLSKSPEKAPRDGLSCVRIFISEDSMDSAIPTHITRSLFI